MRWSLAAGAAAAAPASPDGGGGARIVVVYLEEGARLWSAGVGAASRRRLGSRRAPRARSSSSTLMVTRPT